MKFLSNLLDILFSSDDKEWAVSYMAIEYQKDYRNLQKMGIKVTPDVAINFLNSVSGKNV